MIRPFMLGVVGALLLAAASHADTLATKDLPVRTELHSFQT